MEAPVMVKDGYASGCKHSRFRPKLYESLGLHQGTVNVELNFVQYDHLMLPTRRIPGCDQVDLHANQDFLIRPCRLKGVGGYQILPIKKTTGTPNGHHSSKTIEVSLKEEITLTPNKELAVELGDFED
jgi:hypothetical protein